ncbi:hypothetical protein HDE_00182 [Halotydeus destructor]|nr:hypothetical protein HDE_00182 [Halotydeus destructor]
MSFVLLSVFFLVNVTLGAAQAYYYSQTFANFQQYIPKVGMISLGCLLYLFNAYCGHLVAVNCFLNIKWNDYRLQDEGYAREILIQLRRKQSLKQALVDSLAILPVIWFTDIFMAGSAMTIVVKSQYSQALVMVKLLPMIGNVAMTSLTVFLLDMYKEKEATKITQTLDVMFNSVEKFTNEHIALMKEFGKCNADIDACGLLSVNRSFLLSFFGAVISFSVLLIQVTTV